MAFASGLIGRLMNAVRRGEARDAFSADEADFEDFTEEAEETPSRLGPKLALAASAVMFLLLAGLGVAVYLAGKDAPPAPMVMAPLSGLKVEDDTGTAAPSAAPAASEAARGPDVAATDRSAQRRPWLTAKAPETPVPGKPGAKPADVKAETKPADAKATAPKPAESKQAEAKPAEPKPAEPKPAEAKAPAMTPPTAQPAASAPAAPSPGVAIAGRPADAEPAPAVGESAIGAPDRFSAGGAVNAGGRPRLIEPPAPPIDRKALSAPPPRFAALGDLKAKYVSFTKAPAAKGNDRVGKVTVIVRDLGLGQAATEAAVTKLPSVVVLSFSPYAQNLKKWIEMAKANGHEVLVEVPMESKSYPAEDPGPLGLMTALEPKKNLERLDNILKTVPGAVGIDDDMGSKFRESEGAIAAVFARLKEKNLAYVQTEPGVRIGEPGVPNAVADVIIDERPFRAAIDARLDYIERLAKFQGSAVAVMSAKPVSFERLALWLDTLPSKGLTLAPVSEVLIKTAAAH